MSEMNERVSALIVGVVSEYICDLSERVAKIDGGRVYTLESIKADTVKLAKDVVEADG